MDTAMPSASPSVLAPRNKLTVTDTQNNAPMEVVNGGAIFSPDTPSINFAADVKMGDSVLSVRFDYDGEFLRNENKAPYAFKSNEGEKYNKWSPKVGCHTVKAHSKAGCSVLVFQIDFELAKL